ncbi:unnamed protein product [Pleuronectes platessa]|uniref:Uncharacterized protein n=1 Tax=Pleuronectes platessa TaxID=8262 RepID=A0A9N7VJT2_PLEPL|nr:unnamed protein product [Pleuronectes platessa]
MTDSELVQSKHLKCWNYRIGRGFAAQEWRQSAGKRTERRPGPEGGDRTRDRNNDSGREVRSHPGALDGNKQIRLWTQQWSFTSALTDLITCHRSSSMIPQSP